MANDVLLKAAIVLPDGGDSSSGSEADHFRDLIELSGDIAWEADEKGVYAYVSPRLAEVLGFAPGDDSLPMARSLYARMPEGEAARVRSLLDHAAGEGRSFSCLKNTHRHKDGFEIVLESSGTPIFDAEKRFRGFRGIHRLSGPQQTDLKERRQTAAAAEETLRQVMTSARCLLWHATVTAKDGGMEWNLRMPDEEAARRWLPIAVKPGQDFAAAWYTATLVEDRAPMYALSAEALRSGWSHYVQEFRCRLADGSIRWLSEEVQVEHLPMEPGDATATGVPRRTWRAVGICTDISERKRAERAREEALSALRAQEAFLRQVIDTAPNLIFAKDWDGRFTLVNQATADIYGTTVERLVGKTDAAFNDNPEELAHFLEHDRRVIEGGHELLIPEERVTDASGQARWFQTIKKPLLTPKNAPRQVLGVATDITERKRAEEELRYVIAHARCILWEAEVQGVEGWEQKEDHEGLRWTSRISDEEGAQRLLDLEVKPGDTFYRAWWLSWHEGDRARMNRTSREAFVSGKNSYSQEFRCHDRHGQEHWFFEDVSLMRQGANRWRAVGVCTEITERKRLEAQIIQREKLAALGELVAGVAHEINNPLAAIYGTAQLLQMHPDPQVREDAETIRSMSERTNRIVRSLRSFARNSGEERVPGDVNHTVEAILDIAGYHLKKAEVALEVCQAADLPPVIMDDNQIQQILLNFISNAEHALRALPTGERRIVITTARGESAGGTPAVTISVRDNGCGMTESVRQRMFDPFFTTKDVGEGTGLGLSLCHGIAEAHGGSIHVESETGKGTCVTLRLPLLPGA